jgi:S1-C subfamily serine protease
VRAAPVIHIWCFCVAAAVAGCANPEAQQPAVHDESVVPGTIRILVRREPAGVVVAAVKEDSPAAAAGLRVGDVVTRYNGVSVVDVRQFYRLMVDSPPGSTAQMELLRDGAVHRLHVPVEQIDTTPRA